jgi:hypothetical protein
MSRNWRLDSKWTINEVNIEIDEETCGYFVIATNKPKDKLSMKQAFSYHK